jgi:hypothetical protein
MKSAYIMEKDSMNSEEATHPARTHLYPTQVERREPLPEMRFQYGGMSVAGIQEKKWQTPEEILGIQLPRVEAPPREERPSPAPASTGPQIIEDLHEDCISNDDAPPPEELDEMLYLELFSRSATEPWVTWGMSGGFIDTRCGGHHHEITYYDYTGGVVATNIPDDYCYLRDGIDMHAIFGNLARAIQYVESEILAQYHFERYFWPWVIRLPAVDQALVLAHAHYGDRLRLLHEKYSISGKPWLARRDPPAATPE